MAVAFAAYIDGTNSASSATAVVNFGSRTIGDLAFVIISRAAVVAPSSTPSGWNLPQTHASTYGVWFYWKILAAGDIGNVTWTWAAAAKCLATASVYTGHDTTTPVASTAKGTYSTTSGSGITCGSITSSKTWLVQACSMYSTSSKTYNALTGYTERRDFGGTNPDFWQLLADTNGAWGGGASNPTFVPSAAATYRGGFQAEINPAFTPLVIMVT